MADAVLDLWSFPMYIDILPEFEEIIEKTEYNTFSNLRNEESS